ncbi:MAG: polyprenyl diphosphate synthase [Bdellovibrionota bacterium]|nr:polyprenyl diphosphate synthase [Bdellovibrionota bacterium]
MIERFGVKQCKNVAIIMDGNGRWATERTHRRVWGHVRGSSVVSDIVESADDLGVESLTLYAFSTENWCRPEFEVKTLFKLLKKFLLKERAKLLKNNIKFRVIGDWSRLPEETKLLIADLQETTKDFTGLKLTFAFGYGGRSEIVNSVKKLVESGKEITEENLSDSLYAPDIKDIDLLIRTGGDQRISNFLLWQCAYAELYFTETRWPAFTREEFESIIFNVENRERRFGAVSCMESLESTKKLAEQNGSLFS